MKLENKKSAGLSGLVKVLVIVVTFALSYSADAAAQDSKNGNVYGVVVDEAEHLPMPGVTVAVVKGDKMVSH